MEPGRQFRILARNQDVVLKHGLGNETWHEVPGKTFMDTIRVRPVDPGHLPPVLYHATTNLPAIQSSGVLLARNAGEAGGLGGGHKNTLSVTTDKDIAYGIAQDVHDYTMLAHTGDEHAVMDWYHRMSEKHGVRFEPLQEHYETHQQYDDQHRTFGSLADELSSRYLSGRAAAHRGRNPLIFGGVWKSDSPMWQVDPRNVGVVSFHRGDIPRDALISSHDWHEPESNYYGLKEVKVHADVPLGRATRYDRVG